MRLSLVITIAMSMSVATMAHHPDRQNHRVVPRIDVIGPLGNHLPMSYRRRYNRPSYWKGKIEYWIEPGVIFGAEIFLWAAKEFCLKD